MPARSFGSGEVRRTARRRPEVGNFEGKAFESLGFDRRNFEVTGSRDELCRGWRRQPVELQAQAAMFLDAVVRALVQVHGHVGRHICARDVEMRQVLAGGEQQRPCQQGAQVTIESSGAHGGSAGSVSGGFRDGNSPIIAATHMAAH